MLADSFSIIIMNHISNVRFYSFYIISKRPFKCRTKVSNAMNVFVICLLNVPKRHKKVKQGIRQLLQGIPNEYSNKSSHCRPKTFKAECFGVFDFLVKSVLVLKLDDGVILMLWSPFFMRC